MFRLASVLLLLLLSGCFAGAFTPASPPPIPEPGPVEPGSRLLVLPFRAEEGDRGARAINQAVADYLQQKIGGVLHQPDWQVENPQIWSRGLDNGPEWFQERGISQVLTGRFRLPPTGFLTLELYRPPRIDPVWMLGLPLDAGESPRKKAEEALERLSERMDLQLLETVLIPPGTPRLATVKARSAAGPAAVATVRAIPAEPAVRPRPEPAAHPKPERVARATAQPQPKRVSRPAAHPRPERMVKPAPPRRIEKPLPAAGAVPAPKTAKAKKSGPFRYTLQAGVFLEDEHAERMLQTLRDKGYNPYLMETRDARGRPLRKIWLGRFADYATAKAVGERFLARERLSVFVASVDPDAFPEPFRFGVQVGGFNKEKLAKKLAAKLRRKGYKVAIIPGVDRLNRPWHRVWIGRYRHRRQALEALAAYQSREGQPAFVANIDPEKPLSALKGKRTDETPRYAVQVGSFQSSREAEKIVHELTDKGFQPEIVTHIDAKKRLWHFIWIGRFHGYRKALSVSESYRKILEKPSFVTPIGTLSAGCCKNGRNVKK